MIDDIAVEKALEAYKDEFACWTLIYDTDSKGWVAHDSKRWRNLPLFGDSALEVLDVIDERKTKTQVLPFPSKEAFSAYVNRLAMRKALESLS